MRDSPNLSLLNSIPLIKSPPCRKDNIPNRECQDLICHFGNANIPRWRLIFTPKVGRYHSRGGIMFGKRMESRRKELNMSRSHLAEMLGVGTNTVFRWEKGQRGVDDEKKKQIAQLLQSSVSYLMGETDDPSLSLDTKKISTGILQAMREQTGLSIEEAAALIHLPAEDLEMMEIHEEKADDALKDKLIKAYGKYLAERDGDIQGMGSKPKKGQSEEDLETLLKESNFTRA
ncbi:MAG: XRE family transcriptional regulator, partial [Verrucomicrobiae bacterium]|nr:XRE family transcriptional regulator [Verrucomicrobiae bacterium]